MQATRFIPWLIAAVILSFPTWLTPTPTVLKNFGLADIGQLLGSLLLVALFLERALEVFITTWRGPDAAECDRRAEARRVQLEELKAQPQPNQAQLTAAVNALEQAEQERTTYKSQTQRLALWTGLTLGLLVSAVGIRTLQTLVTPEGLSTLPQGQVVVLHVVDVLLTGGLIAGGSEGIHKVTQVYTNFMEASAKRAKGAGG